MKPPTLVLNVEATVLPPSTTCVVSGSCSVVVSIQETIKIPIVVGEKERWVEAMSKGETILILNKVYKISNITAGQNGMVATLTLLYVEQE